MIKVSVIIPAFNAEKYIKQCLDTVLNQTLKDIEVICVDDGSTDNTLSILKKYSQSDDRVQVIKQKNMHAGVARNKGISVAKGEYLVFLDADDFFEKDMLLSMYNKCKKDNAEVCLCSARSYNEKDGSYRFVNHYLDVQYLPESTPFSSDDISKRVFNAVAPAPWTKMFSRDFVNKNGVKFQDLRKSNDVYFVYLSLALAKRITYVNEHFVNYRIGDDSSLQGSVKELSLDFYTALSELKKELQNRNLFEKFEQSFACRSLSTCLYNLEKTDKKEDFITIANNLRESYFYKLNILGHSRWYFHTRDDYDKLLNIMEKTPEELWDEKENKDENLPKLIDINEWKSPAEVQQNGDVKVSVIIPVYNTEKYVAQCIDSVLSNTFNDFEIICVNDGSTDNSPKILEDYAKKDERIKVINKENSGLSASRNMGMKSVQGEYVLFLDSDDYIEPRTLEFLYAEAKSDDLDNLYFSATSFYDDNELNDQDEYGLRDYYLRRHEYNGVMTGREMFIKVSDNAEFKPSACLQFLKKEFLDSNELSFIDGILYEDNPFSIQSMFLANRVRYANINLYNRRLRANSIMTNSAGIKSAYSYFVVIKEIEKLAVKYKFSKYPKFYAALFNQLKRMNAVACDLAVNADEDELQEYIMNLDEKKGIEFYFYIKNTMELRKALKEKTKQINTTKEKALMDEYKKKFRDAEEAAKKAAKEAAKKAEEEKKEIENKKVGKRVKNGLKVMLGK